MATIFGTTLILGACGSDDEQDSSKGETTETAAGEKVFQNDCASCHGTDLTGGQGPDLTSVGSDHSAEDIEDIIENGQGGMPAGVIKDEDDIEEVASWLAEHK